MERRELKSKTEEVLEKLKTKKREFLIPIVDADPSLYLGSSFEDIKLGFKDTVFTGNIYKVFLDPQDINKKIHPLYSIFDNKILEESFLPRFVDLAKKERERIIDLKNKDLRGYDYLPKIVKFILDPQNSSGGVHRWVLNYVIDRELYRDLAFFLRSDILFSSKKTAQLYKDFQTAISTGKRLYKIIDLLDYVDLGVIFEDADLSNRELAKIALKWFPEKIKDQLTELLVSELTDLDKSYHKLLGGSFSI